MGYEELLHLLRQGGLTTAVILLASVLALGVGIERLLALWGVRAHITPMVLSRLSPSHVETMVAQLTGEKPLPPEMLQQLLVKTGGVPLFVEELTKTVLESGLLRTAQDRYELAGTLPPLRAFGDSYAFRSRC